MTKEILAIFAPAIFYKKIVDGLFGPPLKN